MAKSSIKFVINKKKKFLKNVILVKGKIFITRFPRKNNFKENIIFLHVENIFLFLFTFHVIEHKMSSLKCPISNIS